VLKKLFIGITVPKAVLYRNYCKWTRFCYVYN